MGRLALGVVVESGETGAMSGTLRDFIELPYDQLEELNLEAKAERMAQRRREIAGRYNQAFASLPHLQIPHDRSDCQHAWHLYMLRLNEQTLPGLSNLPSPDLSNLPSPERRGAGGEVRARFIEELKQRHIGVSVHFIPLHLHPYYRQTYGYRPEDFPVAYREYQREISLPIYSKMSDQDVQDVIDAVLEIVETNGC